MHRKNSFFARTILLIMSISTLSSCFNPPEPLGLDILKNDFELTRDYIYMGDYLDTSIFVHNSQDYEGHWYLYASAHFDQGIVFGWFTIPPHYLMVNIETGDGVYINDQIQYDYHCDFNFDTGSATPFWITHSTQTITSEDGVTVEVVKLYQGYINQTERFTQIIVFKTVEQATQIYYARSANENEMGYYYRAKTVFVYTASLQTYQLLSETVIIV